MKMLCTPSLTTPIVFDCFLRPQVWGGRRLASFLNTSLPKDQLIGEAWVLSGHPLHVSRVLKGPWAGTELLELVEQHPQALLGNRPLPAAKFPWLVKFLDCHDMLSVQVHPSDESAVRWTRGEQGKTEAWLILDVEPGAVIYAGLKSGVTPRDLEKALDHDTLVDCLHRQEPRPGDCLFLPAGTIHAVGGGVLMAEVQQTSDATFRLFDWNRADSDGHPRPLHRTEALACIDWSRGPVQPQIPRPIPNLPDGVSAHLLVDCPHFRLSRFQVDRAWQPPASGGLSAWIVLDGQIEVSTDTDSSPQAIERGGAVLIPSTVPNYCLCPMGRAALLHVTMGTPAVGASRIAARRSNGLLGHGSGITGGGRQAIGTATRRPARPCVADRKGEGTRHRPHEKSAESPSGERRRGRAWP